MVTYRFSNMKVPEEKMRLNFNQIVRIFYPRAMETSEMDDFQQKLKRMVSRYTDRPLANQIAGKLFRICCQ